MMPNIIDIGKCETSEKKDALDYFTNQEYTIDDMIMVRRMGEGDFPFDKCIKTSKNGNLFNKSNPTLGMHGFYQYKKELENNGIKSDDWNILYYKQYRDSTYWTINGSIPDEIFAGGTFSKRPFAVLEPLAKHINDPGLETLLEHDTKYNGDLYLSDESVLLIDKNWYEQNKDNPKYSKQYEKFKNIYIYEGNQKKAISQVLKLHYKVDSFDVSSNGYSSNSEISSNLFYKADQTKEEVMIKSLRKAAQEHSKETYTDDCFFDKDLVYQEEVDTHIEFAYLRTLIAQPEVSEKNKNKILSVIKRYEEVFLTSPMRVLTDEEIKSINPEINLEETTDNFYSYEYYNEDEESETLFFEDEDFPLNTLAFYNEEFNIAILEMCRELTLPKIREITMEFNKKIIVQFYINDGRDIFLKENDGSREKNPELTEMLDDYDTSSKIRTNTEIIATSSKKLD